MKLFYIGRYVGKDEEPIDVYKIRTMKEDAHSELEDIVEKNGYDDLGKPNDDPRILAHMKFVRKYWLDELPQLYNMIKGDMRLVGLRPRPEEEWDQHTQEFKKRALRYKPGLMGITYAHPEISSREDLLEVERRYVEQKEKEPIKTDLRYFVKLLDQILLKGTRSR